MAQGQFSGNLYFIDQNETATLSGRHFFHTLVNGSTAVEVTVKGGGVFEFVDVSELADDAAAALYIDPLTGVPFTLKSVAVDSDHGDGFYEKIGSSAITISLGPNQIPA